MSNTREESSTVTGATPNKGHQTTLARLRNGVPSRSWTADMVAAHFAEAFQTLRRLPPVKARGYFNSWPAIVRTRQEIAGMEAEPIRFAPSPCAITRLEQTFDWVLWIEEAERKLIWSRAAKVPWRQITTEMGCDRTTAWRRWQNALGKIACRLNGQ